MSTFIPYTHTELRRSFLLWNWIFVCQKLNSQRPNHSVYCVWAQWLERAQVSKFRFSHGLAQANVLPRQYTWQQALQLFPVIDSPKSICRVYLTKATKLTLLHPQSLHSNPTWLFNSTHPSSNIESPPPPPQPLETTTEEVSSSQPCYTCTPGSPSLITQPLSTHSTGDQVASHIPSPQSATHHCHSLGEKCSLCPKYRIRAQDQFLIFFKNQKNYSSVDQLNCTFNALL